MQFGHEALPTIPDKTTNHSKYAATQTNLNPLINPERVAIIGASSARRNPGRVLLEKYAGEGCNVTAVNSKGIEGYTTVSDVSLLDQQDLVVIAVPKSKVKGILGKVLDGKISRAVEIISAGFEEMGDTELEEMIQGAKIPIQGTNCVGNVSFGRDYTFLDNFTPRLLEQPMQECGDLISCGRNCESCDAVERPVYQASLTDAAENAVISESGAFLVLIAQDVGVSYGFNVGNQSQLSISDYIEFVMRKKPRNVIMYIESIGSKELTTIRRAISENPNVHFVIYKAARNKVGQERAKEHSGRGSAAVGYSEFCAALSTFSNVKIINSFDQLVSYCLLGQYGLLHDSVRCYCVSESGFVSNIFSMCLGGRIKQLSPSCKKTIGHIFKQHNIQAHLDGNLDTTPQLRFQQLKEVIAALKRDIADRENERILVHVLKEVYGNSDLKEFIQYMVDNRHEKQVVYFVEDRPLYVKLRDAGVQCIPKVDSLNSLIEER